MSRNLILGTSAIALAAFAAAAPAMAQVAAPELVIEGPIDNITDDTITVMGIVIKVPSTTKVDTPTKAGLTLSQLANATMPGRPNGFKGGTAIITGGSDMINGNGVTATEVFTDMNENVVVGEVTSEPGPGATLEVNGLPMYPLPADSVIPAAKPMNIYGFEIDPSTVEKGSLISIEGYLSQDDGPRRLYYHALEADTGAPKNLAINEVSILRAQCRDRADTNKDELEIRGAVHLANLATLTTTNRGTVSLIYSGINPTTRAVVTMTVSATPILDPAAPGYAEYRYSSSNRNLNGCPLKITASWKGDTDMQLATTDADAEAR